VTLTYDQLLGSPELAILDVLERTLDVVILVLAAAYPEMHDIDHVTAPEALAALDVVDAARALVVLVNRYRRELALAPGDSADLPF
jgi:hypothetical protein